jgi:hypothetical protein
MSLDFTLGIVYFFFFFFINFLFFIFLKTLFFKILFLKKFLFFLSIGDNKKKLLFGVLYFFKASEIKNFSSLLTNFQKISMNQTIKDSFILEKLSTIFQGYYLDLFNRQLLNK